MLTAVVCSCYINVTALESILNVTINTFINAAGQRKTCTIVEYFSYPSNIGFVTELSQIKIEKEIKLVNQWGYTQPQVIMLQTNSYESYQVSCEH